MKYLIFLTASFLLFTLTIISCGKKETPAEKPTKFCLSDSFKKMIAIDTAALFPITDELELSGEVSFDENTVVKVFPNSSGQIMECPVTLGDKVIQGQVLAVIKSADVAGNYSDLTSSDADVAIAKRQLTAAESLFKNGIASQREFEEAQHNYEKAMAAQEKLKNNISINGGGNTKAGGSYVIRAPRSGYVVEKKVNAGSFIRQDMGDNMFTISDLKDVWVYANVFEADIPRVQEGYDVSVTTLAYPDKKFYGTISKVSQVLDPQNKALKVRIRLDNSELLLKPEMFTKVTVTHASNKGAISIPNEAVVEESGKQYVILYNNDCDLKVIPVDVGKTVGNKTFIDAGINRGQKLITHNALLLYDEFTDNNPQVEEGNPKK